MSLATSVVVQVFVVQVFGRRHDEAIDALMRPAFEKRQGRKSRDVGHSRAAALWGFGRKVGHEVGQQRLRRWTFCKAMESRSG